MSSESKTYQLRRFKPETMKVDRTCLMIGCTGTGKSTLMFDILEHIKDKLDLVLAMSPTTETLDKCRQCMPSAFVYEGYDAHMVDELTHLAKELVDCDKPRQVMLVLDDCMYDKSSTKGNSVREISMNGRHSCIGKMEAAQYLMDIPTYLRGQVGYVFALKEPVRANREKLYKFFFGNFSSFEEFDAVFQSCTQNHECLVLDKTVASTRIEDCVFFYKARKEVPPFRLCKPVYWKLDSCFKYKETSRREKQQKLLERLRNSASCADKNVVQIERIDT